MRTSPARRTSSIAALTLLTALVVCVAATRIPVYAQETDSAAAQAAASLQAQEARYRRAITLAPEVASYHADLAETLERRGRMDEARRSYEEAARLDPASPRVRALLGGFLTRQGDVAGAIEHYRAAVENDSYSPAYAAALGNAYGEAGKWVEAAAAFERAVQLAPADSLYRRSFRAARIQAGIPFDAAVVAPEEQETDAPLLRRIIELGMGTIMAIAGIALVYPIVGGALLAMRASVALAMGRS